MSRSEEPSTEAPLKKQPAVNDTQRRILLAGAVLTLGALLFPPWSLSGGSSGGFHFIFSPPRPTAHVNASILFLQLVALALIAWFLFVAARNVTAKRMGRIAISIIISLAVLVVVLFAWFVWPKSYTEADGVRTRRFTGTRYVWSGKRGWITEAQKKADDLVEDTNRRTIAKPVLDDLSHVIVERDDGDADQLVIYNPTHWRLPYGDSELTLEYYRQTKGRLVLLKIIEDPVEIAPGLNNIYLRDTKGFMGTEPLLESIKITANSAQGVGSGALQIALVPAFLFEHQRICQTEYTKIQSEPGTDPSSDDPYLGYFASKVVCRHN